MNIRRTIKGVIYSAATLLLLFGCAKENPDTPGRKDGKARISFSAPIIVEQAAVSAQQASGKAQPITRAALTEKTTVRVVAFTSTNPAYTSDQAYFVDSDGKLKPCTVNADGSFKAVDMTGELALYPDKYDFYAITPALPLGANKNSVTVLNGIDYASSVTSNINVSNDQTLTLTQLNRKCAKIALVIKKGDDNTLMTALSVASGGVTINNLAPSATTASLNATIAQASGTATLNVPQSVFKTISATETSAITYLLPRLGENRINLTYNLTYTVSGTSETKEVSGSMGNIALESGKSYTFTLTMRQAGASIAVTEWIDGGSQNVETGESFDYSKTGSPLFLIATRDAKNPIDGSASMNWYIANGITDATYNPTGAKACPVGWRVPSSREMMLLWIIKEGVPDDFSFVSTISRWSADTYDTTRAWATSFVHGYTYYNEPGIDKSTSLIVRCIKDNFPSGNKTPKVVVTADNKVIIDSRDLIDKAITKTPKPRTTTATNSALGKDEINDISSATNNKTVSHYFEIAKSNAGGEGATFTWKDAIDKCASLTDDGGGWRSPTQRELMLIYFLNDNIEKKKPAEFISINHSPTLFSATEHHLVVTCGWFVNFLMGTVISPNKAATPYPVRCVRDVVTPPTDPICIGRFGGWDETAQEYTKQLQVDWGSASSDPALAWGPNNEITGATNKEYGPTNITELKKKSADLSLYPAAKYCADKGNGWYLPSQNQLMAIWVAYNGIPADFSFGSSIYWSATEYNNTNSWYLYFKDGNTDHSDKNTSSTRVRCVKDVAPQGTEAPQVSSINSRAIIDNRNMPAKAITKERKAQTTDGDNSKLGTNNLNNIGSAESNKTVSYYFEVMKTDLDGGTEMSWLDAVNGCAAYDSGDGSKTWRLPTQRELMLIWTLHKTLIKKTGLTSFVTSRNYWSATESSSSESWSEGFLTGYTATSTNKIYTYRVRCVRDLTPAN